MRPTVPSNVLNGGLDLHLLADRGSVLLEGAHRGRHSADRKDRASWSGFWPALAAIGVSIACLIFMSNLQLREASGGAKLTPPRVPQPMGLMRVAHDSLMV
jgi:hypothetical protein